MEVKFFKNLIFENCKKLKLEKFKTSFYYESNDSIIFIILRKSGYSTKYYLRIKTEIKPVENNFDKAEFIKHDICDILLSLDSENPEIFDLENNVSDNERTEKISLFFKNNVTKWIKILENKEKIKSEFTKKISFYYRTQSKNLDYKFKKTAYNIALAKTGLNIQIENLNILHRQLLFVPTFFVI